MPQFTLSFVYVFNFKEFESQDNLSYIRGDSSFDVKRFIYKKIIEIYHSNKELQIAILNMSRIMRKTAFATFNYL